MSDDATLSSFGGEESTNADDDESPEEPESVDSATDPNEAESSQPEKPSLTYTSSPDGDTCAACGATVQTRWHAGEGADDPDALVCPDCKDW